MGMMQYLIILIVFGGAGAYYFFVVRPRMSPEGQAKYLASIGFQPGETMVTHASGFKLNDGHGAEFEGVSSTYVQALITSLNRLHLDVGGKKTWFDTNNRPVVQNIGRLFVKDTTGVLDVVVGQTETTMWFIRDGGPGPKGAKQKQIGNVKGVMEPACVLELSAAGVSPVLFESPESAAAELCAWGAKS